MAPDSAFFYQLFFLSSVTKRVGTGNQRVILRGDLLLFCLCFSFFFLFLTVNFVKQATELRICFLSVFPHDVNSFHSYRFCGELWLIHVKRGCQGVSLSSLTLFSVCVLEPLGGTGWLDVGVREVKAERKHERCQILSDSATKQTTPQQHSITPPSAPRDLQPPPKPATHPPSSPGFTSSLTHWTCPRSCMHLCRLASNSPSATATPATQPYNAEMICVSAHSLCAFLLHLKLKFPSAGFITITLIITWVCDRECFNFAKILFVILNAHRHSSIAKAFFSYMNMKNFEGLTMPVF